MHRKLWILAALVAMVAIAVPAYVVAAGPTKLVAELDGNEEVPDKGDPNGTGTADLTLKLKRRKLCSNIAFEDIEAPTAGHIHQGAEGEPGEIVVTLFEVPDGAVSPWVNCQKVKRSLLRQIKRNPAGFYVNVHNGEYPAGALRGQLEPPS